MAILFHDDSFKSGLKERRKVKAWIISVIEQENLIPGNINIIFQGDEDIRKINIDHLSHDYYTDIIINYLMQINNLRWSIHF